MENETTGAARSANTDPRGLEVFARNGERVGVIHDVLAGPQGQDFVLLKTGGLLFHKEFAVPLDLVNIEDGGARLKVTRDRFDGAPEWREGDVDFYRFRHYWHPPLIGGSETVSDADVLIGEEISGTMYSGTDLDTPAQRSANTLRAGADTSS